MKRALFAACICLLTACSASRELLRSPASAEPDPERLVIVTLRNLSGPTLPLAGSTVRAYGEASGYALAPATRSSVRAVAAAYDLREVSAWPIGLLGVHCVVFELPRDVEREAVLAELRRDRRVESAQAYHSFRTLSTTTVNDPYRSLQRNLDLMNVAAAHRWSRGEGVRVAIIDTGVDARHPDLTGRIVRQDNFVEDFAAATADRHGTAVAGVIAAADNNQEGIIGIAPAARLYALRACWPQPEDDAAALCSTFTLAKALSAAIEAHMEIINLSLAGPADPLLTRLVQAGLKRGIVFVGATPAEAHSGFPTDIAGVIGVGTAGAGSAEAALFAPGTEVLTLVPDGRYDFLSGSSLAAASVSGGIALLLARDRRLRGEHARHLLAQSSRPVRIGSGEATSVNLCAALARLIGQPDCTQSSVHP